MIKNRQARTILTWLFKFLVTVGILYYLLKNIPFHQVFASLVNAKIIFIFLALLLQIGIQYLNAAQLMIFSKKQKMEFTVLELMKINFITQFYGLFLRRTSVIMSKMMTMLPDWNSC